MNIHSATGVRDLPVDAVELRRLTQKLANDGMPIAAAQTIAQRFLAQELRISLLESRIEQLEKSGLVHLGRLEKRG